MWVQTLVLRTVRKLVGWNGRRRRWSEQEKLSIVAEVRGGIVDRAPPWHFDVAVVYLAPHLSLRDIGGGAAPPAISQRDSDHVFERKLLSLRRLHFAKALRGPTRAVSPMYFPPKERSRRASILSSMRARSKIWAWFPADSFEVEADRWITTAERRRRNGPSAKLRYQPIDCNLWFGPSRLSFSVLFSVLPRAPSNRPGLQNPGPMWTPPGLSGRPGSRQGRPWWGWD